jgi:hypothetical protein
MYNLICVPCVLYFFYFNSYCITDIHVLCEEWEGGRGVKIKKVERLTIIS